MPSESKLLNNLKMCMRDFHPGKEAFPNHSSVYGLAKIPFETSDLPLPFMVFLTFVALLGFGYYGKGEKLAWSIPLVYRKTPFMISHQKFGLQIAAIAVDSQVLDSAKQMLKQMKKGIRIADKLLTPVVAENVRLGEVSVVNKHYMMYDAYQYFRKLADQAFKHSLALQPGPPDFEKWVGQMNRRIKWERKGFYYARAMLDAFYSWLEHVLILLLPFSDFDRTTENLEDILRSDWTAKYNRILKPDTDRNAKRAYNQLQEIKEKYRNPLTHGYFDKSGASLHAHMPVVGAIPVSLSEYKDSIHYSFFFPITEDTYSHICAVFDEVEDLLHETRFARPFRIIEAGLDVRFDDDGLKEYKLAVSSDKNTEEFIETMSRLADDYANMDW
jgi:hypothetical protein